MYNSYSWICLFHSHCLLIHIQPHVISYFVHIHKRTRFIHIAPLVIHDFHLYSHLYNYAIDNNHSTSHIIILRIYCRYSFHTSLIRYTSQVGSNLFSTHLLNFFLSDVTITHIHINLFHTNVLSIYKCQFVFLQLWHSYTPIIQSHKLFTHVCICFIHSPFRIHTQKRFAHIRLYRLYTNFSFIHALHSYTQNLSSCRIITHTFHTLYSHLIGIHALCRFIHILSLTHIHNSIHSCNGSTHKHTTIIRMKVIFINVFYALTIYFYPYTPFGCSY